MEAKGDIAVNGVTFNHKKFIDRGVKCESCHTNVVTGDRHIRENACLQCHNKREILESKYTAATLHKNHVTDHKVECFTCHSLIKHGVRKPHAFDIQAGECSKCHESKMHNANFLMYLGKGACLVKDMPDRKAMLNMDCTVCHTPGRDRSSAEKTC